MTSNWWKLTPEKFPIRCTPAEFERWLASNSKHVRDTYLRKHGIRISTVFLGLDHSDDGKMPLIFETMVFSDGWQEEYCERYTYWENALAGHRRITRKVIAACRTNCTDLRTYLSI